jgi:Zn-dependent peptidase ImmA (M78 family)/transcriptional regulator with XRE-family HTH domain
MARESNINPSILTWARESAGLDLEEAANRIGLTSSTTVTAADKLAQFESGERSPSRNQLMKFSAVYRRPLVTFYMKEPPTRGERGEDFRRLSGSVSKRENALLDTLLRDVRARQEMVRALLEDDEDFHSIDFVGSARLGDGMQALVGSIGKTLGFDQADVSARKGSADDLFKQLRSKAENVGVFVLLIGDLGSHHSALSAEVFRGFAIADKVAPFIVINDQDAKAARSFTLVHELAHLWLGRSGVSGAPDTNAPKTPHERVEAFCNDVASEFLLPAYGLGRRPDALNVEDKRVAHDLVSGIAETWSVSEPLVAYRLYRIRWISRPIYEALVADYAARWRAAQQKAKDNAREVEGGPSYYVVKQSKLGNALVEVVRRTLRDNLLTHTKAAKVLGVKPSSVEPLLRGYEQNRGIILHHTRG